MKAAGIQSNAGGSENPGLGKYRRWAPVAIVALTLLAFAPAMRGGFIWDDDDYVTHNANLRSASGLSNIWFVPRSSPQYYPLVHTSFWMEYQLWGLSAAGYHVVNVLLHALGAVLLWRVLARLEIPGAFLAACIFAIHPVQAESVAWITERKNVLSGVFYFASALTFVAWASRPCPGDQPQSANNRSLYILSLLFFIAAMLSKTVACSLPAALALLLWWKNGRVTKRQWLALAPMFAIGFGLAMYTAYLERSHVEAIGREWNFTGANRVLIAGRAVWFYLSKLLLPVDLSFVYPKWSSAAEQPWLWAFPVGVVVALLALWRMRARWGRGPLVAALIFAGTLLPALGFFNIYPMRYTFVADHYQYHAVAAMAVVSAWALCRVLGKWRLVALAPLLVLTMMHSYVLADSERLWRDTVAKNPSSWMVHLNLARALTERGQDDEANAHFARQAELAPELPENVDWNLGVNYSRRDMLDKALEEYNRAIAIDDRFPQAYFGRGNAFLRQGKPTEAAAQFHEAVTLKPDYAMAHNELAQLLLAQGQRDQALQHYRMAVTSDPSLAKARVNLAALLAAMGKTDEATQEFDRAVEIDPSLEKYRAKVLGAGM